MMKMKNRSHRHEIFRSLGCSEYKNCLSMMMLICIKQHPSNIWRSIHEKLSNTEANLQKVLLIKRVCISLVLLMIPPCSWWESVFNLFFVPSWISSLFYVNGEKISFSRPDFVNSETVIWGLTSLTDFYKKVQLLFKIRQVSDCQKKISFVQKTHLNSHIKLLTLLFITPEVKSYH